MHFQPGTVIFTLFNVYNKLGTVSDKLYVEHFKLVIKNCQLYTVHLTPNSVKCKLYYIVYRNQGQHNEAKPQWNEIPVKQLIEKLPYVPCGSLYNTVAWVNCVHCRAWQSFMVVRKLDGVATG